MTRPLPRATRPAPCFLRRFGAGFVLVLGVAPHARAGDPRDAATADPIVFKQVAAPASDVISGRVRLPEPRACATTSPAQTRALTWTWTEDGGWVADATVAIAADGPLAMAVMSTDATEWQWSARRGRNFESLESFFATTSIERRSQAWIEDAPGWTAQRVDVSHATAGSWTVRVTATGRARDARPADAWLIVRDAATWTIAAHTSTLSTVNGDVVGVVAFLADSTAAADRFARETGPDTTAEVGAYARSFEPAIGVARAGRVTLETPAGTWTSPLFDDGTHEDGAAGDGRFGAVVPRWTSGQVRARVELDGVGAAGAPIRRDVTLDFPMMERRATFSGTVTTRVEDDRRLRVELGALPFGPVAQLHVSAEVWGTDELGRFVPLCWLSRMVVPEERGGEWKLPLFLDGGWIAETRARAPFALRHVRLQDPDTHVPYDVVDVLPLEPATLPPAASAPPSGVTTTMLMAPATSASFVASPATQAPTVSPYPFRRSLLLVHGYCSGGSIWPAADFTQPKAEFLDPNQNRTHDQFAQLLLAKGNARSSFGVVGHSQGGPAALHLYTYYVSSLDNATGGRRIQSVASPYQGTPLASLGSFACGVNNDMTPSGSTTWLAGIPTWARSEVWYWTTSDNGSACNFFTGLLLTNPEDGTVEQFRGQLPGANSMGHVTGWCHTTGMSYPANYTDHARNALMNAAAAR